VRCPRPRTLLRTGPHVPGRVPRVRRRAAQTPAPGRLSDRPEQPEQRHVLAVRDAVRATVGPGVRAPAARQRHAHTVAGQKVRAHLHQPTVLPEGGQTGLDSGVQEHGLRQDLATVPVLLGTVPQGVRPAEPGDNHQGQRTGGPVHGLAQIQRGRVVGFAGRVQHAGGPSERHGFRQ